MRLTLVLMTLLLSGHLQSKAEYTSQLSKVIVTVKNSFQLNYAVMPQDAWQSSVNINKIGDVDSNILIAVKNGVQKYAYTISFSPIISLTSTSAMTDSVRVFKPQLSQLHYLTLQKSVQTAQFADVSSTDYYRITLKEAVKPSQEALAALKDSYHFGIDNALLVHVSY